VGGRGRGVGRGRGAEGALTGWGVVSWAVSWERGGNGGGGGRFREKAWGGGGGWVVREGEGEEEERGLTSSRCREKKGFAEPRGGRGLLPTSHVARPVGPEQRPLRKKRPDAPGQGESQKQNKSG